jgi:hypothetical protein
METDGIMAKYAWNNKQAGEETSEIRRDNKHDAEVLLEKLTVGHLHCKLSSSNDLEV